MKKQRILPSPASFVGGLARSLRGYRTVSGGYVMSSGIRVSISGSSMFGSGISGVQATPCRFYEIPDGKKCRTVWLRGTLYGVEFPTESSGQSPASSNALIMAGWSSIYRPLREAGYSYGGAHRRSLRRAIARGDVSLGGLLRMEGFYERSLVYFMSGSQSVGYLRRRWAQNAEEVLKRRAA